jgi:hypothetical protein
MGEESGHIWKIPGMPHRGWECTHVEDLNPDEEPAEYVEYATCEACGKYPIRFVHSLKHDDWEGPLDVGRICAEHLTEDYVNPRLRESLATKRAKWLRKPWRVSAAGNLWIRSHCRFACVFANPDGDGFKAVVDGIFSRRAWPTEDAAKIAVFDFLTTYHP